MIYRLKKGKELHNQLLAYIQDIDKWTMAIQLINNDLFNNKMTEVGISYVMNENKSFKVDIVKLPKEYQNVFSKTGWLLPNNKYYKKWQLIVDKLDLHSIEKDYLNRFLLSIFVNPKMFLDLEHFDLLIKVEKVLPQNSGTEQEHKNMTEDYELTELIEFPV